LAERLAVNERTVRRSLDDLVKRGAILRTERRNEYSNKRGAWLLVRDGETSVAIPPPRRVRKPPPRRVRKPPPRKRDIDERVDEVFAYLNASRRGVIDGAHVLEPTTGNTKALRARLREGKTVDNCKHVIDAWVQECREGWQGNTAKPREHFVPTTVFRPESFEKRLARSRPAVQTQTPQPRFVTRHDFDESEVDDVEQAK
jgi:uncharacterized phage protein (TIGR02220 family)